MAEVVLITSCAGNGIGRALAENLNCRVRDGQSAFKVFATAPSLESLTDLEQQGVHCLQMDVTDANSVSAAVDAVIASAGHIDILICNPGMAISGWIVEVDYDDMRRMFDINVFGIFRVIQAVVPHMMDRRSGKISTFCTANAWVTQPFGGPFAAWKSSMAMMTEALRVEVEPFGIQVTSVVNGWYKSDMMAKALVRYDRFEGPDGQYAGIMNQMRDHRKRMGKLGCSTQKCAEDIAKGLLKPRPPRFVYTGTGVLFALFGGFIQTWISSTFIARKLQRTFGLDQTDKLGRPGFVSAATKAPLLHLRRRND